MKILTNGKEIISSGSLSSFSLDDIEFVISEENSMSLILHVEGDQSEDEATISSEVTPEGNLKINVRNPHVSLNFGPSEPMRIGHIDGKAIYFAFRIDVMGEYNSYLTAYTFYKEV